MKLTHLSRNTSESSKKSSLSVRNNSIYNPSIILKFSYSTLVISQGFIGNQYRVNNVSRQRVFKCHHSCISKVGRVYEENDVCWYEYYSGQNIFIESFLYCSNTEQIGITEFFVSLLVEGVVFPKFLVLYLTLLLVDTSFVLKNISAFLTFIPLFSSHESIFLKGIVPTFFAPFCVTFSHLYKSKGVFGSIMPNTPIFSHTLFSNMPKNRIRNKDSCLRKNPLTPRGFSLKIFFRQLPELDHHLQILDLKVLG